MYTTGRLCKSPRNGYSKQYFGERKLFACIVARQHKHTRTGRTGYANKKNQLLYQESQCINSTTHVYGLLLTINWVGGCRHNSTPSQYEREGIPPSALVTPCRDILPAWQCYHYIVWVGIPHRTLAHDWQLFTRQWSIIVTMYVCMCTEILFWAA